MDAYVLNLPHRTDRWEQLQKDFKESQFNLIQVKGVIVDDPDLSLKERKYHGVALTHIELVKKAKQENKKTILILEDDCKPEPNYIKNWIKIKDYLDTHLDDWDVFNGAICGIKSVEKVIQLDDIYLVEEVGGAFCHWLYINVDKAIDKLCNWTLEKKDIDLYYTNNFKHYTCLPLLAEQYNGYSDISMDMKDWHFNFIMARLDLRRKIMTMIS